MKRLLIVVAAAATLGIAAPASAQVFLGADSGGVGVQLGPLGVGVGPRFSDDRYYHRRDYYDANAYNYGDITVSGQYVSAYGMYTQGTS